MNTRTILASLAAALTLAGCGSSSSTGAKGLSPATSHAQSQAQSQPSRAASQPAATTGASAVPSAVPSTVPSAALSAVSSAAASAVPSAAASAVASVVASAVPTAPVVKGGNGSDLQFCQAIALNLQVMEKAANNAADPSVEQAIAQIRHLESIAPAEIKGDLKVIGDYDQNIVDALRSGKAPNFKETPALTDAIRHQGAWSATHCGH